MIGLDELEMLHESNLIENEKSAGALLAAAEAWEYLKGCDELTDEVVRRVHEILFTAPDMYHTLAPKWVGFYRNIPVYIGQIAKMDYASIPGKMALWIADMNYKDYFELEPETVEALAQAHHVDYENIHPFVDGNGRTGRMFYNWHRLRLGLPVDVIRAAERAKYYKWFEEA